MEGHTGYRITLDLASGVEAPSAAREALDRIEHGLDQADEYTVKLLISELVSNSVKHWGQGSVQVEIESAAGFVRVDVIDRGPAFSPGPHSAEPEREGGWGLVLVDELATRWGSSPVGAHVWFELEAA
ncbi:MAG TPA: ATP-binding protein [Thermoleophilaceae bacterium]